MKKKWIYPMLFLITFGLVMENYRGLAATEVNVTVDYQSQRDAYPAVFGSQIWWTDQDSVKYVTSWRDLGLNTVRIGLVQSQIEPQNDDADPFHTRWENFYFNQSFPLGDSSEKTVTLSRLFRAIRDAELNVIIVNFYIAAWNSRIDRGAISPFPPRDLAEHREFLHTFLDWLVNQIHFPPARIILEPMNEPDYPALGFWENGTLNDIAAVSRVAYQAAKAVDARIRVIGPSEALGTTITEKLMREYNGAQYFDGLAWHYYGVNFAPVYDRVNSLKSFGLPLFLTEFGNFEYSNEELAGVLWHSYILAEIWQRAPELQPIQFTLTSFPTGLDEKNIFRLALQTDWRYQWERRPAFQIYQNFWHLFRGTTRVNSVTNAELNLIAARNPVATDPATLFLWMTNPTSQNYNVNFKINDFPSEQARILVRSNLDSTIAVDSLAALGTPLRFMHYLPAYTSVRMELRAFLPSSAQTDQLRPELKTLHLAQNYPNPFNPITRIDFYLPEATQITLNIFDLNGTLVRRLISGPVSTKFSSLTWDGLNQHGLPVTSGVYFYQLKTNKMQITKKLMLIR